MSPDWALDAPLSHLVLRHPTREECVEIWSHTAAAWRDSLTLEAWFEEQKYMTTVPLAKDGGMTQWILVDENLLPNQRPILASCESIRKLALTSDATGAVEEAVVHGVASVFCFPKYRGHGYTKRMMQELANVLGSWQLEGLECVGTILYSDIGKGYYAKLGWNPNTTNHHLELDTSPNMWLPEATALTLNDLPDLCARDEALVRNAMAIPDPGVDARVMIIPTLDHMLWHIAKEDFACKHLFGTIPPTKGAIAGRSGNRVWAIWTHRYYSRPDIKDHLNVLYILRLVFEAGSGLVGFSSNSHPKLKEDQDREQMRSLKAVLQAAQKEAREWKLDIVRLWDPTPQVKDMLKRSDVHFEFVDRQEDYIASAMWYPKEHATGAAPSWLSNEHYAWL